MAIKTLICPNHISADFVGVLGALILRTAKDQIRPYLTDPSAVPGAPPLSPQKTSPGLPHTLAESPDHATGVSPARSAVVTSASARAAPQRLLLSPLAESGQQTPIVVVTAKDDNARYLVIDGYKRIAALRQLGRDTVEATV
jgi:hypothetical protein